MKNMLLLNGGLKQRFPASSAAMTSTRFTKGGVGNETGPETSVILRQRRAAAAAIAKPILPGAVVGNITHRVERFARRACRNRRY